MSRIFSISIKFLILVLVLGLILGWSFKVFAQEGPKAKIFPAVEEFPKRIDKDKNKIFDTLEDLYKDQSEEASLEVIIVFNRSISEEELKSLKSQVGDFSPQFTYRSLPGIFTTLTKRQIKALAENPLIKQIEDNATVIPFLNTATYWFGVQKARTDFAVDGNLDGSASYSKDDIVIAVIDTGIDPNHIDLDGGKIIGWKDYATSKPNPYDEVTGCGGHGTHVSSIAAGEGQADSNYKGVAPGAALVGVKVLKKVGNGCSGTVSNVNAGIQWVIDNKATYGIEVINMSIGIAGSSDGTDSTSVLANSAVDNGIVTVVAAGNEGPTKYTIGSPAAAAKAITVGAMADVYPGYSGSFSCGNAPGYGFYQGCFSSRGPTADNRIKPDISAPGMFITAAKAGTTNQYQVMSGTSMSSPFTAGLAGLILAKNSSLTPSQIKSKIMLSALDWGPSNSDIDYGAGRLDGYEAIKSTGGLSGTNIAVPDHQYQADSLSSTNTADWWNVDVKNTSYPIAVTMIMPDWTGSASPDFDMELYAPNGTTLLAYSRGTIRQETIGYQPAAAGVYKLRVYRYAGSGNYFFDQSAGLTLSVAISITTDGQITFGYQNLNTQVDTTAGGLNDVQTIHVDTGPVDLAVKSTKFSDGTNLWNLGTTNGSNQVKWDFSANGTTWTNFTVPDTLYGLASSLATGANQNIYFQLLMPTSTSSYNQHGVSVTVVATAP